MGLATRAFTRVGGTCLNPYATNYLLYFRHISLNGGAHAGSNVSMLSN